MKIREAGTGDIQQIQIVRNSVRENILSNPDLVTDADCALFLTQRGKGWVCEIAGQIVGFSIADLQEDNVWALFLLPDFEKMGIGQILHKTMLDWYFAQNKNSIWLSTTPGTRAEGFYRKSGWKYAGTYGKDEVKFEMDRQTWIKSNTSDAFK